LLESIIAEIDVEISRLQQAKELLSGVTQQPQPGRTAKVVSSVVPENPRTKRRTMSAEAKKRIAEAQHKRWAEAKKTRPAGTKGAAAPPAKARKKPAKSGK
jgi:hypothetical protein